MFLQFYKNCLHRFGFSKSLPHILWNWKNTHCITYPISFFHEHHRIDNKVFWDLQSLIWHILSHLIIIFAKGVSHHLDYFIKWRTVHTTLFSTKAYSICIRDLGRKKRWSVRNAVTWSKLWQTGTVRQKRSKTNQTQKEAGDHCSGSLLGSHVNHVNQPEYT